jgi:hypothetical protein
MKLHYEFLDRKMRRNFILLHGLMGNLRNLNGVAKRL